MEITLNLPEQLAIRVSTWAQITERNVPEMVETALDSVLPPFFDNAIPMGELADNEVIALTQVSMDEKDGERLTRLQRQQREGTLDSAEKHELFLLMQQYNFLWLRQSQALAEAVKRGIMPSIVE